MDGRLTSTGTYYYIFSEIRKERKGKGREGKGREGKEGRKRKEQTNTKKKQKILEKEMTKLLF